ncbi:MULTISPECIES: DUF3095 family protein [unclassified Rhizobium]|uniref:DUF3095 family protein n=1 Tax=unclassified Rhizobium TaxID=2613769 RepID=UPI0007EAFD13|nr:MULTISPECIES: DUF3095 family protein [unclassified Rhizobium]ANM11022.1 hypothetical protein AMK05_CH02648 [Rhizobium sp. N324]ANM17563.1 hypothetical protein AMK06_CH02675 [Rhizobium sp. N541]ANM23948.1 hypothetical protein AMK07_CH02672 [Rhizobium sp. N941]OYD04623.1 hypothetical protein AMK08_CH102667 [Rhizobium sp. N4311]
MINSHAAPRRAYDEFSLVLDPEVYEPLPDDWLIGITDVVNSTAAIRAGRYEDVNYAGASIIAALGNAWGSFDFPFVFRGDGAAFALPANGIMAATSALRDVAGFARTDLHLDLRVGLVTVGDIRANGRDVRIARYAASESATYAMFAGGGLKWAEQQIKSGRFLVKPGRYTMRPDLTGLSCDWAPFPSQRGEILSLLVEPRDQTRPEVFAALAKRVLAVFDAAPRRSRPYFGETAIARGSAKQVSAIRWSEVASNSDFRKFDDGLRLTLDCAPDQIDAVEAILVAARARGEIDFGLHRQSHALMTCLVPSGRPDSHLHFLDGMGGGYARAAEMMEEGARREVVPQLAL